MKNDQVNVITKFIGKSNPYSVQIINHVFQLVGNYLRPFENGKKYSHFLNDLVRKLASRIQKENKARTSLQKALVR